MIEGFNKFTSFLDCEGFLIKGSYIANVPACLLLPN